MLTATTATVTQADFVAVSKFLPQVRAGLVDWAKVTEAHLDFAESKVGKNLGDMRGAMLRKRDDALLNGQQSRAHVETKSNGKTKAEKVVLTDAEVCLAAGMSVEAFNDLPETMKAFARAGAVKAQPKQLTFKVSEKGAISVYGLNVQFPTTLYVNQWERLFECIGEVKAFIAANASNPAVSRK